MDPMTHSVAKANVRDAIAAYGAGHGALYVPVERRIAQFLWQERLFAVGGCNAVFIPQTLVCTSFVSP